MRIGWHREFGRRFPGNAIDVRSFAVETLILVLVLVQLTKVAHMPGAWAEWVGIGVLVALVLGIPQGWLRLRSTRHDG